MAQHGKEEDEGQYERVHLSFLDTQSLFMKLGKQALEGKASPCSAGLLWKPLHQCQKSLSVRKVPALIQRRKTREECLGSPEELDLISVRSLGIKLLQVRKELLRSTTTIFLCSLSVFFQPQLETKHWANWISHLLQVYLCYVRCYVRFPSALQQAPLPA